MHRPLNPAPSTPAGIEPSGARLFAGAPEVAFPCCIRGNSSRSNARFSRASVVCLSECITKPLGNFMNVRPLQPPGLKLSPVMTSDLELTHAGLQGRAFQTKSRRRAVRAADPAISFLKSTYNTLSLGRLG